MAIKVLEYVRQYNEMLEKLLLLSRKLVLLSEKGDIAAIDTQSQNRDRLVNIMSKLQFKLEQYLLTSGEALPPEVVKTLSIWDQDVRMIISDIQELDKICMEKLQEHKMKISLEITQVHKNKGCIQGYNLSKIN